MGEHGEPVHTRHLMLIEAGSAPLQMSDSETKEGNVFYDSVEDIDEFCDAMDECQLAEKLALKGRSQKQ